VLHSLAQTLGLVAPSLIGFWSPKYGTQRDKGCDRNDGDNQSHLRPPFAHTASTIEPGILIIRLSSWLIQSGKINAMWS
jgi:hypothetical protein